MYAIHTLHLANRKSQMPNGNNCKRIDLLAINVGVDAREANQN